MTVNDNARLAELDRAGFLPADGQEMGTFFDRAAEIRSEYRNFICKIAKDDVFAQKCGLKNCEPIPRKCIAEAAEITAGLFGFSCDHAPGFFSAVGGLWGGCTICDPELPLPYFLLRKDFSRRKKWFCYRRDELLAHELCHIVRAPLADDDLEEYFAYRTSYSALRRWCGDIFSSSFQTLIFAVLALSLPVVQAVKSFWLAGFPVYIFQLGFAGFILYLAAVTFGRHRLVGKAEKKLAAAGIKSPLAVLFRLKKCEIRELLKCRDVREFAEKKARHDLRWQIIRLRFFSSTPESL